MILFKEIQLLPEIFLGISIIYLIIHGTFKQRFRTYSFVLAK